MNTSDVYFFLIYQAVYRSLCTYGKNIYCNDSTQDSRCPPSPSSSLSLHQDALALRLHLKSVLLHGKRGWSLHHRSAAAGGDG